MRAMMARGGYSGLGAKIGLAASTTPPPLVHATATGLNPATSSGFSVTPGAATQLVFGTQPSTTVANHQISPAVKVRALDRSEEHASELQSRLPIVFRLQPGKNKLSGTTPGAAVRRV